MVPGIAGLAAVQINLLVNSWLATGLGTGAVSWLDYAFRLMYMPIGLFGISIATAALPGISGYAADNDDLRRSARRVERAAHDADAQRSGDRRTRRSRDADRRVDLRARQVYGRRHGRDRGGAGVLRARTRRILGGEARLAGVLRAGQQPDPGHCQRRQRGINIVLSLILARLLGHRGLALGTAIAALVNAGLLLWMLRARLGGLEGRRLVTALMKISVASAAMGFAAYSRRTASAHSARRHRRDGAGASGVRRDWRRHGVLGFSALALRIEEFRQLIRRRLSANG